MQRNYAPMTKVRAMYGKHLTSKDYEALIQMTSVGEVAGYLKRDTPYTDTLREVREDLVHRGQLENLIRRRKLDIYLSLARYTYSNDTFLRLFIIRSEVEQLLAVIRTVSTEVMERLVTSFPAYLAKYMSFDLFKLAEVRDFDHLLRLLAHTPYYEVLLPLRPTRGERPDITECEHALLSVYFKQALDLVDRRYSGEIKQELRQLLLSQVDLHNLQIIYRMKSFFGEAPDDIARYLIKPELPTSIRKDTYRSLLEASDASAVLVRLRSVPMLQRFLFDREDKNFELVIERYQQKVSLKSFRFSNRPVIVILSYMMLLDIEISNIVNIIEGIRYHLRPEEIRALLVI